MIQLHVEQCELTYEGAYVKPAFSLIDCPGKLCDVLMEALESHGCTSADLMFEKGEPGDRGVTCEVDALSMRVTLYGDRLEVHCANFAPGSAATAAPVLESVWAGLVRLNAGAVAKTHSFLIEADAQIRGASYGEVLKRLARPPEWLPAGTETAIVYYLPGEHAKGYGESSLVLNRSTDVERGLQVNATLVYEAQLLKVAAAISAARDRFDELLRNLGLDWIQE